MSRADRRRESELASEKTGSQISPVPAHFLCSAQLLSLSQWIAEMKSSQVCSHTHTHTATQTHPLTHPPTVMQLKPSLASISPFQVEVDERRDSPQRDGKMKKEQGARVETEAENTLPGDQKPADLPVETPVPTSDTVTTATETASTMTAPEPAIIHAPKVPSVLQKPWADRLLAAARNLRSAHGDNAQVSRDA